MIEFVGKKRLKEMLADASDASIWRWVKSGILPQPRQIGPNRVGWLLSELEPAMAAFPTATRNPVAPGSRKGRKPRASAVQEG